MKYCLSVAIHNLYFDIAIIDKNYNLIGINRCMYDRSKDISSNIYLQYKKNFSKYSIVGIGVAISNNIGYKDDVIYSIKAFNFNRYNLKQALLKQFKVNVSIIEETHAGALGVYYQSSCDSLLYVIVDNKISNSIVVNGDILLLEDDIDFSKNDKLNEACNKDNLKKVLLAKDFDDEYVGGYFISQNNNVTPIVETWAKEFSKHLEKIVKIIKVNKIILAGYLGSYFEYYKRYMKLENKVEYSCVKNHKIPTLMGVSHLIFKDN